MTQSTHGELWARLARMKAGDVVSLPPGWDITFVSIAETFVDGEGI